MARQIAMTRPITAEQCPRPSLRPVPNTPEWGAEAAEAAPRDLLRHDHGGILDKIMLLGQPPLHLPEAGLTAVGTGSRTGWRHRP